MSTMDSPESTLRPTLAQVTHTFVPFALLLSLALMAPELPQVLEQKRTVYTIDATTYYRAVYSIWVTMAFLIPAVVLYFLPGESERKRQYARLFWTFGLLAYLVHFHYTVGVVFHDSLREVYAAQGVIIATSNLLVTVWWAFDVILSWMPSLRAAWVPRERTLVRLYIPLTFFISAVVIKHGVVRLLGIVMTVAILVSLAKRVLRRSDAPVAVPSRAT